MNEDEREIKSFNFMSFRIKNITRTTLNRGYEYTFEIALPGMIRSFKTDFQRIIAKNLPDFKLKLKQLIKKEYPYKPSQYPSKCYDIV